jgi:hypothetical protein
MIVSPRGHFNTNACFFRATADSESIRQLEIIFSRLKEAALEIDFREDSMWFAFDWLPPVVKVEVDLWADEAVEGAWFDNITPCPCRTGGTGPATAAR